MKINETKMKQAQEEALKILQETEDKPQAIVDAMEKINEVQYADIIAEITEQVSKAESDEAYAKTMGLRVLSKEEKDFYEALKKDPKQAVTGNQIDIMPTSIVDITLEDIKKESGILSYINFAPANVKKWITASKTGAYSWGGLTDKIKGELTTSFSFPPPAIKKNKDYLFLLYSIARQSTRIIGGYFLIFLKNHR